MSDWPPATSGATRAEAARARAQAAAAEAAKFAALADKYAKGDEGERLVARALDVLDGAGWVALHDRWKSAQSRANIDHILVGPPGVCVIDAKNWSTHVAVDERGLRAGSWRKDQEITKVLEAARHVAPVARATHAGVITAAVMCFVGDVGLATPDYRHDVVFLQLDQLLSWLTSQPRYIEEATVRRLGHTLEAHFPPRTERPSQLHVPVAPPSLRPLGARPPGGARVAVGPAGRHPRGSGHSRRAGGRSGERAGRIQSTGRLVTLLVLASLVLIPGVRKPLLEAYESFMTRAVVQPVTNNLKQNAEQQQAELRRKAQERARVRATPSPQR